MSRNWGVSKQYPAFTDADEIDRKAFCFGLFVAAPLMLIAFALFVMGMG